jgi:CHAT domain-containing protein/tetratricopeptide (TPR) repeat protein
VHEEEKHLSIEQVEHLVETQSGVTEGSAEPGVFEDVRRHVAVCEACRKLVSMHQTIDRRLRDLRAEGHFEPGHDCPCEAELVELATGRLSPAQAGRLFDHVVTCAWCGPILRNLTEVSDEPLTPQEESMIGALNSSRTEWQRDFVARLHVRVCGKPNAWGPSISGWRKLGFLPRLSYVGAIALLLALGSWLFLRLGPERVVERLIAEAYSQQRNLELRIPGAPYGPLRILRGAETSRLNRPRALLEAESLIAEKGGKRPDDPEWLDLGGRANLLDGDFAAAISALERAHDLAGANPQIALDLATAYFLRAERLNHPIDYGKAAEILGQVLASDPDNSVALFNRAITEERIFLYKQAEADWEHFLRLNPYSEWTEEARARLEALRDRLRTQGEHSSRPLVAPGEFAHELAVGDEEAIHALDPRVEMYLDVAFRSWLSITLSLTESEAAEKFEAQRGLRALADILRKRHGDLWLGDFLRLREKNSSFDKGASALVESYRANNEGNYDRAISFARKAAVQFVHGRNKAGLLQARWQTLYATRLSYRTEECLVLSRQLWSQLEKTSYQWLRARVALDYAQCASLNNFMQMAKRLVGVSLSVSQDHGFIDLNLRAIKVSADIALTMVGPSVAFDTAVRGLERYWKSDTGYMPGYNLYSSLDDGAESAQSWNLDASFIREALYLAQGDPDSGMRAVMEQRLADALSMSGDQRNAASSLNLALTLLAAMSPGQAVQAKEAEVQVRLATIDIFRHKPGDAIIKLNAVHDTVLKTANSTLSFDFFAAYGKAQNDAGRSEAAVEALLEAVGLAEIGMRSLPNEQERLQWIRRSDPVYRELVRWHLRRDTAAAFSWWESYKAASLPRALSSPNLNPSRAAMSTPLSQSSPVAASIGSDTAILTYAVFPDGIASWIYDGQSLQYRWIAVSAHEVELESRVFASLCSDPGSDVSSLIRHGRKLYEILIQPIQPLLRYTHVIVEPDGELSNVPYEALVDTSGHFWGDSRTISYSPGLLYLSLSLEPHSFPASSRVLVLADSSAHPELNLVALPEAETEAREVASGFKHATLLIGPNANLVALSRELPSAELFHFSGHAIANAMRSGLILRDSGDENGFSLFSAAEISGSSRGATRLVVLSACGSALGTEGHFTDTASLARSFMAVNVTQVIASRWSVDSESSKALMEGFYRRVHSGLSTSDSLHFAEADLRKRPGMAHPFYWAAFAMFGRT